VSRLFEVVDLTKEFPGRVRAVDGVGFGLAAGRTTALVGESGSGKSTVAKLLAQLLRPTSGGIRLDGAPVATRGGGLRRYRRDVQIVFQDPFASLNPAHTVAHHLRRPLKLHGRTDVTVTDLLDRVNLVPARRVAGKRPHELSGGQRQRVAIARALATRPRVLLADEPVSMLDVSIRLEILNLLDRLRGEDDLALLYITHDLATARHFSAEVLVMYRGEIVEAGGSDEVILRPRHPYTQLLASAAPDPRHPRAAVLPHRTATATPAAGGCPFRARCPHAMDVCAEKPPALPVGENHTARCWLYREGAA
jgi:peptide/nickel transport system ATP-binding protein